MSPGTRGVLERLNQECFCITLNRDELVRALAKELGDAQLVTSLIDARPHLFSNTPVFMSEIEISDTLRIVRAVEAASALPGYRNTVLSWAPDVARHDPGTLGVFMGYDFHLTVDGPKLIEVNTNAGGAFLNALLCKAQSTCCAEVDAALTTSAAGQFESAVSRMFENEWRLQGRTGNPKRIAVIDDKPEEQYLYPEFLLAQRFFARHGLEAHVCDASRVSYERGLLTLDGKSIDLLYNRLVDFSLSEPTHAALRAAYLENAAVITPNPHVHALLADKRNMTVLSDQTALASWGLSADHLSALGGIPRTVLVTPEKAEQLWVDRKKLFFKPAGGYGSKAVYRGDKVTKGVWTEIIRGGYVAQEFAAPSERKIRLDGELQARKADVRLYVYDGEILLTAARLYQGQTTNFRTPGGGFAPLLAVQTRLGGADLYGSGVGEDSVEPNCHPHYIDER